MNFRENVKNTKDINLCELAYMYGVDLTHESISEDILDKLETDGFDPSEDAILLTPVEIERYGIDDDAVDYTHAYETLGELIDYMEGLIKPAPAYLVYASGVTWDGADGYTIVRNIEQTLVRSYDASIYPRNASRGGKVLDCVEYNHDCPTGCCVRIIALTKKEEGRMKNMLFSEIKEYVEGFDRAMEKARD